MGGLQVDRAATIEGRTFTGYAIDGLIGRGGMGAVYRARRLTLGQPVAIKVLSEELRTQPAFVTQFELEARLQANLQHPHVMPVVDGGEADGLPYLVMRFVEGCSLHELIRAGVPAALPVIDLLTGVASALDHAHTQGVLHLDVKPQNVLIEGDRHAWLADFGLTRMLEDLAETVAAAGPLGSLDYMAPEVARGERPSPASDIYSLAVTAFQSLTGILPFPAAHRAADVLAHARDPRPRASAYRRGLPRKLDAALQRGMATEPASRPPTAGALAGDLREAAGLPTLGGLDRAVATIGVGDVPSPGELPTWAPTLVSEPSDARLVRC